VKEKRERSNEQKGSDPVVSLPLKLLLSLSLFHPSSLFSQPFFTFKI
jgi:hypothetical protein